MIKRTATLYVVLEAKKGWRGRARVVRHSANQPDLKRGQCAVRLTIEVPDEAFEPVLKIPEPIVFAVEETIQATAVKA